MYCSSCGTPLTRGLSYCNRCGAQVNPPKDQDPAKKPETPFNSLMEGIFLTTFFGLGIICGGVITLKVLEIREVFLVAYAILSSLAFLGIYSMYVVQFVRLTRPAKETNAELERFSTKELDALRVQALPEPQVSVTDHTTRTLDPVPEQRRTS